MADYLFLFFALLLSVSAESSMSIITDKALTASDVGQQIFAAVELFTEAFREDENNGTLVKLLVNAQDSDDWDFEGKVGIVWAFDGYNNPLGSSDVIPHERNKAVDAGEPGTIAVVQYKNPDADAQYIDIIASDDEICISAIFTKNYNSDTKPFAWTGDVGKACGQAWEFGAEPITGGGQAVYKPACVWLDEDHGDDIDDKSDMTDTITNRQMKINLHAYSGTGQTDFQNGSEIDIDYVCGSTIFTHDMSDPIAGITPRGPYMDPILRRTITDEERMSRRDISEPFVTHQKKARPRTQKMAQRLWVNSNPQQSAIELCNSPTSRGSDFVSQDEGLFCDMDTKTLHPLCSSKPVLGCFDLDASANQLRRRDIAKAKPLVKQYKKISYSG